MPQKSGEHITGKQSETIKGSPSIRLADQSPFPQVYLGRYLKLLVFFQQLLGVLDAGPCRGVCGKVELPIVMDPL